MGSVLPYIYIYSSTMDPMGWCVHDPVTFPSVSVVWLTGAWAARGIKASKATQRRQWFEGVDRLDWPIVGIQPGLTNRTYHWDGKRVFFMAPLKGTVYDWEVLKNWCLMQLSVMVIGLPLWFVVTLTQARMCALEAPGWLRCNYSSWLMLVASSSPILYHISVQQPHPKLDESL